MGLLNDDEIEAKLAELDGWERRDDAITKDFDRGDFVGSVRFVDSLVAPAEEMGHHPDLAISGVVLTMFDGRTNLSSEVANEVRRHLGDAVFRTIVPRSVRLSEAPSHGLPIALYRPDSKGAEAYQALAGELRSRRGPGATLAGAVA